VRIILVISVLLIGMSSSAQTFVAKSSHSSVGVGERIKITYTLEGADGKKFIQPTFNGFRLLSGPNTSSNMQWVNGNFSSSKSFSFILLAMEEGEYTIPAAGIKTGGNVMQSNTVDVTITKSKQKNKSATQNSNNSNSDEGSPDLSANIFMKQYISKKEAYVGEQIVATYKLYVNAQVVNYVNNRPVYNGFYAQDIEQDPNAEVTTETLNGKQYRVATMKKVVLTAQKSGDIEVAPLEMEMVVRVETRNNKRTNWNPWGASVKDVKYKFKSNAQTLKVKALPTANQPANFSGAVGNFKLKAKTDLSEIKVNEAVNLTIEVEGRGNIDLMPEPSITLPKDFETYEPKVKKNVSVSSSGTSGKKSFKYVLIPRYSGEFQLPTVMMSYFEPKSGTYKTIETAPISLNVLKSNNSENPDEMAFVAPKKEDVQILGNDIRYISTKTSQFKQEEDDGFFGSPSFYAACSLPFAAMGISVLLIGRIRMQESNIGLMKSKKANKIAKKHLAAANKLLAAEDAQFYEEIFRALYGYLSDKLGIPVSELTKETIAHALEEKNVPTDTIDELTKALNECEMARFAPGAVRAKNEMLIASTDIIEKIEDVS
jgi:hypothetical protein